MNNSLVDRLRFNLPFLWWLFRDFKRTDNSFQQESATDIYLYIIFISDMECQQQAFVSLTPSTLNNKNYSQTFVFILDILIF